MGDTMILATVVANKDAKDGVDFLPLTVDYREKFAADGRIPGGFFRREARPSEREILVMRIVDRALRPLFPDDFHAEVQLMMQLIAYDGVNSPDALVGFAASSCIAVSDIPFNGPMSEVRVGRVNGEFVINPTLEEMAVSDVDCIIAGTIDNIVMVEGELAEASEAEMVDVIKVAHEAIKKQCQFQLDLAAEIPSSSPKREYEHEDHNEDARVRVAAFSYDKCREVAKQGLASKEKRAELFGAIKEEFLASLTEEETEEIGKYVSVYFKE
jgi:polyribonucleotide nucleotidyltransferase